MAFMKDTYVENRRNISFFLVIYFTTHMIALFLQQKQKVTNFFMFYLQPSTFLYLFSLQQRL